MSVRLRVRLRVRVRLRARRKRALALVEADESVARRDRHLPSHLHRSRLETGIAVVKS